MSIGDGAFWCRAGRHFAPVGRLAKRKDGTVRCKDCESRQKAASRAKANAGAAGASRANGHDPVDQGVVSIAQPRYCMNRHKCAHAKATGSPAKLRKGWRYALCDLCTKQREDRSFARHNPGHLERHNRQP